LKLILILNNTLKKLSFTAATDTVKLHPVPLRVKAVGSKKPVLQTLDLRIHHFNEPAALRADQMIMMLVTGCRLIPTGTVLALELNAKSGSAQQFQRTIDSGIPGAGIFLLNILVNLIRGQMLDPLQQNLQNIHPLVTAFQAIVREILPESCLILPGSHFSNPVC